MRMIKGSSILAWTDLKRNQELHSSEYIEWVYSKKKKFKYKIICVSHRWITAVHPDPNGEQLRELQQRLMLIFRQEKGLEHCLVFYDYCSMPQNPRTAKEEIIFRNDIASLDTLFLTAYKIIILSEGYTDYKNRAWCFFEAIISEGKIHFFDDQEFIKGDLSFLDSLLKDPEGVKNGMITSYDMSSIYKIDPVEAEVFISVCQHLNECKVTHPNDFPLIKHQMMAYFNKHRATSFGKLIIAMIKYFNVVYYVSSENWELFACKPYFEESTWVRLPVQNIRVLDNLANLSQKSVFALSQADMQRIQEECSGTIFPLIQLSVPSVSDLAAFLGEFQQEKNWKRYLVDPFMIGKSTEDHFPGIEYVVHTMLEVIPEMFSIGDLRYLYMSLVADD